MEKLNFIIAKRLSALRKENKLTQLELAEKLNYSDKAVSKWEQGESMPGIEVLYKLSKLYNVSIDYIVGEETATPKRTTTPKTRKRRVIITLLAILAVWLVALVIFTILDLTSGLKLWIVFCWSVPVSAVVTLVFDSVWNKSKLLFLLISLLIWSLLICLSLQLLSYNIWKILFIGIPLQIATFLWSKMVK